ncbi:hypothetical protein N7499_004388 [Penicillium canescens]|uniref:Uncharacterized protein n=1 Tax=Penicillium canescens TaxID=5083 RepID=A0AAD6IAM4_PENCN|nr:uncharacterized protein N7446_005318 [Penicillium canescens]KAJ6010208.1 hypothetical protein N7522_005224 [Penicillium canescens]KAJ6038514.1 hypothetical protein N7460_008285 [Penicillium canescens]KAJ6039426.1 hypothetical protein N7444_008331 [Penicillium canescens]KAJ6068281.1 hypothetical protein N7446_005318 [Penicillium canescens]KAJ6084759.1 hypothetical protein N7499_004388 [Penicillium canescens]
MMYCNKPSEQARVTDGKETSRWLSCGSEKDQKVRQRTGSARESPEASEYFAYEKRLQRETLEPSSQDPQMRMVRLDGCHVAVVHQVQLECPTDENANENAKQ